MKIFSYGMLEHEKRTNEMNEFQTCLDEARKENKSLSVKHIDEFELYKKKVS